MNGKTRRSPDEQPESRHIYVPSDMWCDRCKDKLIERGWDYTKTINQVSGLRAPKASDAAILEADATRRARGLTWKQAANLVRYKCGKAFKRRVQRLRRER